MSEASEIHREGVVKFFRSVGQFEAAMAGDVPRLTELLAENLGKRIDARLKERHCEHELEPVAAAIVRQETATFICEHLASLMVHVHAPKAKELELVARLLQEDPHDWSKRPCPTCRTISAVLGRPFGCSFKALVAKQREADGCRSSE